MYMENKRPLHTEQSLNAGESLGQSVVVWSDYISKASYLCPVKSIDQLWAPLGKKPVSVWYDKKALNTESCLVVMVHVLSSAITMMTKEMGVYSWQC